MKFLLLLFCRLAASSVSHDTHPVEKVIGLLQDLKAKVEEEGRDEELSYEKFQYWCKNSQKTLSAEIAKGKEKIEELQSSVSAAKEEVSTLTDQIAELETELGEIAVADTKASGERGDENKLYESADADYKSTIKAIDDAITALKTAKTTTDPKLLQKTKKLVSHAFALASPRMTQEQQGGLSSFIETSAAPAPARAGLASAGDYEDHVDTYSFKSDSVVEMLKKLKSQFEEEHLAAIKAETNSANAYALALAARKDHKTAIDDSKATKTNELGDTKGELSTAQSSLSDTEKDLKADSDTLAETVKVCNTKAAEWAERSDVRKQEMEAIDAAVKILAKASGVRTAPPENPVPPTSPVFMQLTGVVSPGSLPPKQARARARAVELLRMAGKAAKSGALESLADAVLRAQGNAFDQVINMIQKMIYKLMAEQTDEDTHKQWCDAELSKSTASKDKKDEKVTKLSASIDETKATVLELENDIKENNDMIASITEHMAESQEIRAIGKEENTHAIKDAVSAQTAIANAIAVLETFYKESGMIAELQVARRDPVQLPAEPASWDSAYTGAADPAKQPDGIVAVLQACSADFAKMEADTRSQEQTDQMFYQEEMKKSEIEKARRMKDAEMKSAESKRLTKKQQELETSRKHVAKELDAVEQYLRDLEPACVSGDSTYEERKSARSKEIAALKEAQVILAEAFKNPPPAVSFLQRKSLM